MAAANDRDVSDIRTELRDFRQATTSSFNAVRGDLADLLSGLIGRQGQGEQQLVAKNAGPSHLVLLGPTRSR